MRHRPYTIFLIALALAAVAPSAAAGTALPIQGQIAGAKTPGHIDWVPLPGPGKKVKISEDFSFTYEFSQRPQMGTVILVVRVTDKKGAQVVPYKITGRSDMPEMRGAHDSGDVEFKTNKAANYLLPVNIVMPGEWEVQLTFSLNGQAVYYGCLRFTI